MKLWEKILIGTLIGIAICISYVAAYFVGVENTHIEAVETSAAQFYLDKDHRRQFRWIKCRK